MSNYTPSVSDLLTAWKVVSTLHTIDNAGHSETLISIKSALESSGYTMVGWGKFYLNHDLAKLTPLS